jgi:hypothetical protein
MQTTLYGPTGLPLTPPTAQIVDPTFSAARITGRPAEYSFPGQLLGHYKVAFTFSNSANITTTPLVTIRWAPSIKAYFVLHKLRWTAAILTTAFTTQQLVDLAATVARNFISPDTGGSSLAPSGNQQKCLLTMNSTLLGQGSSQLLVAAGAIAAGAGRTLDGNFAYAGADIASNSVATGGTPLITSPKDLHIHTPGSEHPMVLSPLEGIILNCPNSLGAAGVVKWGFVLEWLETLQF